MRPVRQMTGSSPIWERRTSSARHTRSQAPPAHQNLSVYLQQAGKRCSENTEFNLALSVKVAALFPDLPMLHKTYHSLDACTHEISFQRLHLSKLENCDMLSPDAWCFSTSDAALPGPGES